MNQLVPALEEQTVVARAADAGYRLVQCETDTGQVVRETVRDGSTSGSYGNVTPSASRLARAARAQDARIFMTDVTITASDEGSYLVSGSVHLTDVDGREVPHPDQMALCRCGHSTNKPFCDGAHATSDFDGTLKH
jgi:CDGSH-type Zn-finger protein